MKQLLYISSSLFGDQGQSTRLANRFVDTLTSQHAFKSIERDLTAEPVPHLDATRFAAFNTPAAERSDEQQSVADYSAALIDEWRRAELVVIALPLYNLGVPSTFKAYIDHIARAGETFRYTENGPAGLLRDRKVYVIATRGGQYQGTPLDTQSDYLRHILGLMGISDIEFIYAEGLNMREETAKAALEQAQRQLLAFAGGAVEAA